MWPGSIPGPGVITWVESVVRSCSEGFSPGGGGESHMKVTGMLVVSLRVVNFGFLVSLRVFRVKRQYF